MRIFGFTIIRSENHDAFVKAHNIAREEVWRLRQDVVNRLDSISSLQRTINNHEDTIEALKIKCSRVNVSGLENEIRRLQNEKMSGAELQVQDNVEPALLQSALVQPPKADAECGVGYGEKPGDGFSLTPEDEA